MVLFAVPLPLFLSGEDDHSAELWTIDQFSSTSDYVGGISQHCVVRLDENVALIAGDGIPSKVVSTYDRSKDQYSGETRTSNA